MSKEIEEKAKNWLIEKTGDKFYRNSYNSLDGEFTVLSLVKDFNIQQSKELREENERLKEGLTQAIDALGDYNLFHQDMELLENLKKLINDTKREEQL